MPMPRLRCRQLCRLTLWLLRPKHTLMPRSGPASTCSAFAHMLSCTAVQIEYSRGSVQICSGDWLLKQACSMHSPGIAMTTYMVMKRLTCIHGCETDMHTCPHDTHACS